MDDNTVWNAFDALADGVVLMQVMSHISPDQSDVPDTTALERLESIVLVLEVYFERDLAELDASAIALEADSGTGAREANVP